MLKLLLKYDEKLLFIINGCYNDFFDVLMFQISNKWLWIPLYLVLIYFLVKEYGKKVYFILFFTALLILFSDLISVHLFKNIFLRLRPCQDETINSLIHLVNNKCGGKYGFVSSHATNHFAIAVFIGLMLKKKMRFIFPLLIFWASIIGYSRVYLGVHFPTDVIAGSMIGAIIGYLFFIISSKFTTFTS